jgi:hypothetical protein
MCAYVRLSSLEDARGVRCSRAVIPVRRSSGTGVDARLRSRRAFLLPLLCCYYHYIVSQHRPHPRGLLLAAFFPLLSCAPLYSRRVPLSSARSCLSYLSFRSFFFLLSFLFLTLSSSSSSTFVLGLSSRPRRHRIRLLSHYRPEYIRCPCALLRLPKTLFLRVKGFNVSAGIVRNECSCRILYVIGRQFKRLAV